MLVESALSVSCVGAHESETLTAVVSTSVDLTGNNNICIMTKKVEDIYCILFSILQDWGLIFHLILSL